MNKYKLRPLQMCRVLHILLIMYIFSPCGLNFLLK
nr:MAG TPA: Protein of unknown function (DUF4521) [Caudoviricetes sp.]